MKYDIDFDDPAVISNLIKTMIEKTPVAYIVLDKNYRVRYINENFLQLRKLTAAEVMGVQCFCLSNSGVPCNVCAVRQTIATGQRHQVLRKDVLPDGTVRYIDDQAIPLYKDDQGNFDYILEIMINRSQVMKLRDEANKVFYNIVKMLISVLDKKDPYTSNHSADVSAISSKLAKFMGLSEDEINRISLGALLHDIGKVHIPDMIINKATRLTNEEYEIIKRHPEESYKLIENLDGFDEIKDICLRHHEKWDGTGYPGGLAGAETPLGAHIVGLADTYDAMTSDRSYRKGLAHETALDEIRRYLGTQFSPLAGEKFLEMAREYFDNREKLIAKDDRALADYLEKKQDGDQVIRSIQAMEHKDQAPPEILGEDFKFDEKFISLVYQYTPAFYTIISESFDILYASDSLARAMNCPNPKDLVGGKCFEVNNKNMICFKMKDGTMACPVVRAFHSGLEQAGTSVEHIGGKTMYFDIYAVPIEILNRQKQPVRCALEIMFDRTDEVTLQLKLEKDLKALIMTLEELIKKIDPTATGNAGAIIQECDTFGEFLIRFSEDLNKRYERHLSR